MIVVCPQCGNTIIEGDRFCRVCGRAFSSAAAPVSAAVSTPTIGYAIAPETSGKAIASLIFGFFFFVFPAAIVAIILGHLSLSEIRKSAGRLKGDGLAIGGLVLGYMGIVAIPFVLIIAAIAIPNLLRARIAANESSAVATVRTLNTAEVSYSAAHENIGFTCSLEDLRKDNLIDTFNLASGGRSGYVFELTGCDANGAAPNTRYLLFARPEAVNKTGKRSFCSDESGVVKYVQDGSAQDCAENGTELQ